MSGAMSPPSSIDPTEQLPGGDREVVVSFSTANDAAGGVGDLVDVRLVHQEVRDVARDPPAEAVGLAERRVEGQHRDRVGTPTPAAKAATVVRSMFT